MCTWYDSNIIEFLVYNQLITSVTSQFVYECFRLNRKRPSIGTIYP